jgi:peptidoglycan biosynthesis protein MviN/MurJ (putative lipid II flippase)
MGMVLPYLLALLATILIEVAVLVLLGERRQKVVWASVAINIITNVPLNIVLQHVEQTAVAIAIGEAVVVINELLWYYLFVRNIRQAAVYSILCNAISFLIGLIFVS